MQIKIFFLVSLVVLCCVYKSTIRKHVFNLYYMVNITRVCMYTKLPNYPYLLYNLQKNKNKIYNTCSRTQT